MIIRKADIAGCLILLEPPLIVPPFLTFPEVNQASI
jgi:hypothetical protein